MQNDTEPAFGNLRRARQGILNVEQGIRTGDLEIEKDVTNLGAKLQTVN
jgi:hypothetical protein